EGGKHGKQEAFLLVRDQAGGDQKRQGRNAEEWEHPAPADRRSQEEEGKRGEEDVDQGSDVFPGRPLRVPEPDSGPVSRGLEEIVPWVAVHHHVARRL